MYFAGRFVSVAAMVLAGVEAVVKALVRHRHNNLNGLLARFMTQALTWRNPMNSISEMLNDQIYADADVAGSRAGKLGFETNGPDGMKL